LKELISDLKLAPTRLGMTMPPTFYNIVVVQPTCSIIGKYKGDARIWRMDTLVKKICDDNSGMLNVVKVISPATLRLFATKLAALHKPGPEPKLSLPSPLPGAPKAALAQSNASAVCQGCGGQLSAAEAKYCRQDEPRFARHLLCRKCQSYAPKATPANVLLLRDATLQADNRQPPRCEVCGAAVDQKVVFFCRINQKRFAGRLLCRACQPPVSKPVTAAVTA